MDVEVVVITADDVMTWEEFVEAAVNEDIELF